MTSREEQALALLQVFRDVLPGPCRIDHNGNCQEHWAHLGDECAMPLVDALLSGAAPEADRHWIAGGTLTSAECGLAASRLQRERDAYRAALGRLVAAVDGPAAQGQSFEEITHEVDAALAAARKLLGGAS